MKPWERAEQRVGVNAPGWLTFEVHRPYFDGGDSPRTALQARGPLLAAALFEKGELSAPRFGMLMPSSYRRLLVEESRLTRYRVRLPTDLRAERAAEGWRRMADAFRRRAELTLDERAGLAQWLTAACLHDAVLELAPEDRAPEACRTAGGALVQYSRAMALFLGEGLSERTAQAFAPLVDAPAPTIGHALAASSWAYVVARHGTDDARAPSYADRADELLASIEDALSPLDAAVYRARLAVRRTIHAERHEDLDGAWALLEAADEALAGARPRSGEDDAAWHEARRRSIDRRVELAVRRGDPAAEEKALADGLALDPFCVKIRMQVAQAAERSGDLDEALPGYLLASRLGPFGTAFALLRAAECARRLGHAEVARVANERAFRAAPRSDAARSALEAACVADGDDALAAVVRRVRNGEAAPPRAVNWHYRMYGAYFDLGESHSPCLYAGIPRVAYDFAVAGEYPRIELQRIMPPAFRRNLIRESGLDEFHVARPENLARNLRTPAWEQLCDWVAHFPRADVGRQYLTCHVLFRLGFHDVLLDLVPERPAASLEEPLQFYLYYLRELSRYTRSQGRAVELPAGIFELALVSACPLHLRLRGAVFAVVVAARAQDSREDAELWRARAEPLLEEVLASDEFTPFEKAMLESRFYRGVSFVPFMRRDRAGVVDDLDRAERLAREGPAGTPWERYLKVENLHACLESRSKEAFGLGDVPLGHARTEEFLAIDPYDPKSHIEMGESLMKQERFGEAGASYLRAARLGPLGTAIGYAMAGEQYERAGEPVLAEDCYVQALRVDAYAISAARGWHRVAGDGPLKEVASEYAVELEAWGAERSSRAAVEAA